MNTIKKVVGAGDKGEEEAASGTQVAEGTTAEPSQDSSAEIAATKEADTSAAIEGKDASSPSDSKQEKSSGLGFLSKNPFKSSKKDSSTDHQASAGAEKPKEEPKDDLADLPPNHLGSFPPPGTSTDIEPNENPNTAMSTNGKQPATDEPNSTVVAASADNVDQQAKSEDPFKNYGDRPTFTSGGPKMTALKASRASSISSAAADKSRREPLKANNPLSIPTAGGKPIGGVAMAERERRKSRFSSDMGIVDQQGSPDEKTAQNTQANVVPNGNGEGSSKVAGNNDADLAAQATANVEGDENSKPVPTASPEAETKENQEASKDANFGAASATTSPEPKSPSSPTGKERRGSVLEDLKSKLKIGGKKDKE